MKNLFSLLERFSKSLNKDTDTKEAIVRVIYERIGIKLPPESLSLKEGVLTIATGGAVKNEVKLKEELILSEIRERYKTSVIRIVYR